MTFDYGSRPGQPFSSNDFSAVSNGDLEHGIHELDRHQPSYRQAKLYAEGRSPELFLVSEAARRAVEQTIDHYRLNFAAIPIHTIADRLSVMGFRGEEAAVERVIGDNDLWSWCGDLIKDTLTYGDAYVILGRDIDDMPVLNPVDAESTRVIYDDELERYPRFAIRRWKVRVPGKPDADCYRVNLWYDDHIERYIRVDDKWTEYYPDESGGNETSEEHGYAELPVIHFRNGVPYGRPIHYDAFGPQDMIVKLIMTFMASVEYTGWPQRYILQDHKLGGQTTLPGVTGSQLSNTADREAAGNRLTASPGTLWELFGRTVGTFQAADLDRLTGAVEFVVRSMAQVTRIPFHYFDPSGDVPSGQAQLMADAPVKAMAGESRRSMTSSFDTMMSMAVTKAGGRSSATVETIWAPDSAVIDQTWWETAAIRHGLGISLKRIWTEAGYTEEQMQEFDENVIVENPPNPSSEV